jgi:hypothetical protein
MLSACLFPEKFDATITIHKDGRFSLSYEGILTFVLARMAMIENGKLSQEDEREIRGLEKEFLKDPKFRKSKYIGNGQFDVVYELKGSIEEKIYFPDSDIKIVTMRLVEDGLLEIEGMKISQSEINDLKKLKMHLRGNLRIKTNGKVLKENATGKPLLGGLIGTYHWKIESVEDPAPYILIQLSTKKKPKKMPPSNKPPDQATRKELSDFFDPLQQAIDRGDKRSVEELWIEMLRMWKETDVCNATKRELLYLDGCARFLMGKWERSIGKFEGYLLDTTHGGGSSSVLDLEIRRASDGKILYYTASSWTIFYDKTASRIEHHRDYSKLKGKVTFWYDRPSTYGPHDARILVIEFDENSANAVAQEMRGVKKTPGLYIQHKKAVDVLVKPHVFSDRLGTIPPGTQVISLEAFGDFYRIEYDRLKGYIYKDLCIVIEDEAFSEKDLVIKKLEDRIYERPKDISLWLELARKREKYDDKSGAMDAYRHVLELSPNHEVATKAFLRLRIQGVVQSTR